MYLVPRNMTSGCEEKLLLCQQESHYLDSLSNGLPYSEGWLVDVEVPTLCHRLSKLVISRPLAAYDISQKICPQI